MDMSAIPWGTVTPVGAMVGMVWALFRLFASGAIAFRREVEDTRAQRDAAVAELVELRSSVSALAGAVKATQGSVTALGDLIREVTGR